MAQTFLSQTQAVSIALVNPAATRRQDRGKNSRQTYKIRELGQPYCWDGSRERAVRVICRERGGVLELIFLVVTLILPLVIKFSGDKI